jgi:hypothetical protein
MQGELRIENGEWRMKNEERCGFRKKQEQKRKGKNIVIRFAVWFGWMLAGVITALVRGEHFFGTFFYIPVFVILPLFLIFPVWRSMFIERVIEGILNALFNLFR